MQFEVELGWLMAGLGTGVLVFRASILRHDWFLVDTAQLGVPFRDLLYRGSPLAPLAEVTVTSLFTNFARRQVNYFQKHVELPLGKY
jgi:hypothetical protein